jgi:lipopolysaccharide heptosyltransferase I
VSERFLIVRLGALGDVVHAIPVAAALRRRFPAARIDWLVDPRYVPLLDLVAALDRPVACDPRAGLTRLLRTIGELRRVHYDAAFDLQGLLKSALLARAAGAVRTIGMTKPHLREPLARLLYTETVDPGDAGHVMFKNLALLAAVGIDAPALEFPLRLPASAAAAAVATMSGEGGYVLINPGAAWPNKRWPAARFGALATAMHSRLGLRSVVLWGPGEESLAAAVVAAAGGSAVLAPPTVITDILAIARGARLFISGDTGPLHLAGAAGTPIVALFGPTLAARNGPWAAADIAISRVEQCACVYERRCRRATPCIDDIGVDEVMQAVERRVQQHG